MVKIMNQNIVNRKAIIGYNKEILGYDKGLI